MAVNQNNNQGQHFTPSILPMSGVGLSRYSDYPACKPFINTDFTRADGPVNSFPISNRDAIISALRNLDENVKKLEIERNIAQQNLQSLTSETEEYKELLSIGKYGEKKWKHDGGQTQGRQVTVTIQNTELESELMNAQYRCHLLEKQLQQMREMVESSEQDRKQLMGQKQRMKDMTGTDMNTKRLNELEREQRRLTLTQRLAESKIGELEQEVRDEKLQRETLQDRTAQLETVAHSKTCSSSTSSPTGLDAHHTQARKVIKPTKKKNKLALNKHSATALRSEQRRHYRLDLAGIPFVARKSTGPSHSLGANVQKVLAMLKLHNAALCSSVWASGYYQGADSLSSPGLADADQDLSDLLVQLQDEFGQLSSMHQELIEQIYESRDVQEKNKLEQELDTLLENMENKSQQISIIRQHEKKTKDVKRVRTLGRGTKSKQMQLSSTRHYHHHHHLNSSSTTNSTPRSYSRSKLSTKPELFMLRDIQKLQCKLRREDLNWE